MTSDYEIIMDTSQNASTRHQVEPEVIPPGDPGAPADAAKFDYADLEPNDRARAIEAAAKIRVFAHRTVESVMLIGQQLTYVKEMLPHGAWQPWLETEFGWGVRQAQRMMNVYWEFGFKKTDTVSLLEPIDLKALYLLAAPSTPQEVRDEAVEKAATGERVTHASVKAQLDDLKSRLAQQFPEDEPAKPELTIERKPARPKTDDVDPEKQAAFRLDAALGGRLADFGLVDEAPETVARAVKPVMRSKRREQILRLIAWLEDLLNHLEEQDV